MEAKWCPKCFKNQAPVRGASGRASGSDFGRCLEGRRGSPEAPKSAPGGKMTSRRAKRSPRRAKVSSGRLPGAFWEGYPTHFQATRGDRDAPYSNRRRGRAAPEQGYRLALRLVCFRSLPRGRARKLRKRRTRNSRLCLVVLCLASSRRCLCSSPRLLRRLRCLRLSLFTRFPFLDSQVSLFRFFFQPLRFLRKCNTFHTKTLFFEVRGVPKWS